MLNKFYKLHKIRFLDYTIKGAYEQHLAWHFYIDCLVMSFQLGKLTVAVLKEFIKKEKIDSSGSRKADLIDAISAHYGVEWKPPYLIQ